MKFYESSSQHDQVQLPSSVTYKAFLKWTPKLMLEDICMCFHKAIVQSMIKHVASENGPLVLILQSNSQIVIVFKHID